MTPEQRIDALLPTRRGQPTVLTNAGPEHGIERGHWYSPAAVRLMLEAAAKPRRAEIKQLEGQKRRLEDMLFSAGRMEQAPCFVCGYNGPGYFQPGQHKCAARHHKLREAMRKAMFDEYIRGLNDNVEAMKKAGHNVQIHPATEDAEGDCSGSGGMQI